MSLRAGVIGLLTAMASLSATANEQTLKEDEQKSIVHLSPLVVSGTLSYPFGHQTDDHAVTALDNQALIRSGKRGLEETLQGFPSLNMLTVPAGGVASLTLRGASGYGLIQIDGIPLPISNTGQFNLAGMPAEAFENTEMIRGSGAVLYGSHALGGLIRLSTRDLLATTGSAHIEGGSFGALRDTVAGSWAGDHGRISGTYSRDDFFDGTPYVNPQFGDGYRKPANASLATLRGSAKLGDVGETESSLVYSDSHSGYGKYVLTPEHVLDFADDPNAFIDQETWLAQNRSRVALHDHWQSGLQFGFTQQQKTVRSGTVETGMLAHTYLARWENLHQWITPDTGTWRLTWGGEGWYEDGSTPDGRYRGQRATGAAVGRLEVKSDRYSGVVGFRTDSYEQYGVHTTFHAGSQYRILPEFAVFADGGIGYRLPSFPELLTPFIGNPTLRPEHGASGQAGFNWDVTGSTQLSLTGYYNRFDDLIILARLPIGLYRSENIPNTRIMGLEMQGATAWNAQFSSGIDYTLSSNENLDTGAPLPHRPDNIGRFWTEWRGQTWPLRLWSEAIYRGASYSDGRNIRIGDALLINMTLNYIVDPRLSLYVRGENITNNQTSDTYILGVPGAAMYGGIRAGLP